jgi:hypothetical protein
MTRVICSVIVDCLVDQPSHNLTLAHRIDAKPTNFGAYALLD